jgi:hypothetical protein
MHPLSDRDIQRRDIDGSVVPSARCLRPWSSAHPAETGWCFGRFFT